MAKVVEHKFSRQTERRIYTRVAELMLMQTMKGLDRRERRELAKLYGYEAYRMANNMLPLKKVNGQIVNYVMMSGMSVMEEETQDGNDIQV